MGLGAVPLVRSQAVAGPAAIQMTHEAVPKGFGQDGGGGNDVLAFVAAHNGKGGEP